MQASGLTGASRNDLMPPMSGSRRGRALLWILAGLFALRGGGIAFVRHGRHQFGAPEPVRGGVVRAHGQVSDFFAARTPEGRVLLFDAGADPEGRGLDALLGALKATREDV